MENSYVSVFKIDGIPIVAPMMTPEIRIEMLGYKNKALEIEKRLMIQRLHISNLSQKTVPDSTVIHEDIGDSTLDMEAELESNEYLKISNLLPHENAKKVEPIVDSNPSLDVVKMSPPTLENNKEDETKEKSPNHCRKDSFTLVSPSPGLKLPILSVTPPATPTEDQENLPRLIRSNSYTLENPSPMLVKHLKDNTMNIKTSSSMTEISNKSKQAHVKKLSFGGPTMIRAQTAKAKTKTPLKKETQKPVKMKKPVKSPYDTKVSTAKVAPKVKKPVLFKVPEPKPIKLPEKPAVIVVKEDESCEKRIQEIQEEHNQKMLHLLKQQEEEQVILQEKFRKQQEELMKFIHKDISVDRITTSTPILNQNETEFKMDFVRSNSQSSCNMSTSQTLYLSSSEYDESVCSEELFVTCEKNDVNGNFGANFKNYIDTINQNLKDQDLKELTYMDGNGNTGHNDDAGIKSHKAATIINAHVRGYLVRRLFNTEQIQKIVQIIRDTLLFILDLHHERAAERSNSSDLQLKRTLLHQLTSACYSLHDIFFETTTAERLEIIRKDREFLRRKLNNSLNSSKTSISQYKNLQLCSLKY